MPRIVDSAIDYLIAKNAHLPPIVSVLAFVGLRRVARVTAVGMAALWLVDQIRHIDLDRAVNKDDRIIDQAAADSFPASDAPAYSGTTAGSPEGEKTFRIVH